MKKLLLILLSLVLCFSAVACTAEDDTSSSTSTESKVESNEDVSENSFDNENSSQVSDNAESSKASVDSSEDSSVPEISTSEFDINNVIYNSDGKHYGENDIATNWFREVSHHGLAEYIKNGESDTDTWFCVKLSPCWNADGIRVELFPYLDEIGFIKDDALTESFGQNDVDKSVVGYITKEMFKQLHKDNYSINYTWLPKACVDAGGCHKVIE